MSEQLTQEPFHLDVPETLGPIEDPEKAEFVADASKDERERIAMKETLIGDLRRHMVIDEAMSRNVAGAENPEQRAHMQGIKEKRRDEVRSRVKEMGAKIGEDFMAAHGRAKTHFARGSVDDRFDRPEEIVAFTDEIERGKRWDEDKAQEIENWAAFLHDLPNADPTLTAKEAIDMYEIIQGLEHFLREGRLQALDERVSKQYYDRGEILKAADWANYLGIYDDETYHKILRSIGDAEERGDELLLGWRLGAIPSNILLEGARKLNDMKDELLSRLGLEEGGKEVKPSAS